MSESTVEFPGLRTQPLPRAAAPAAPAVGLALPQAVAAFLAPHLPAGGRGVHVLRTAQHEDLEALEPGAAQAIVNTVRVNDIRFVNKFFMAAYRALPHDGALVVGFETKRQRRARIFGKVPRGFRHLYYGLSFVLNRVFPKLPGTKHVWFALTRGRNRPLSRAEVLGRLCFCGFEIAESDDVAGQHWVVARRTGQPSRDPMPSYGPFFRMRRVGKDGEPIHVYKLRTMHPYSEYLQAYVFERNDLAEGGKLRDDFRVTGWGRLFRRLWLDELPMLINWIRRDLKLVGVRPLSPHFESLYPADVRERRRGVRPGLVPPYYADMPKTLDEIVASEARYLDAYQRSPLLTDARYLFRAAWNILVKRARSQ